MLSRLALGTAQFGLDYGISNKRGRIPKNEVFSILNYAKKHNINTLDTSYNYGESEKIIGQFIQKQKIQFKIISKLPASNLEKVDNYLQSSLKRLKIKKLYGYLLHDFKSFLKEPLILKLIKNYQKKRVVEKIGFSLYYPKELEHLLKNNIKFDIIQVPYNIFDQRFTPYFNQLKKRNIEIHSRSVFLQGLLFKKSSELNYQFLKIKSKLVYLHKLSQDLDIPLAALCLNFVLLNKNIDKIIIGVDNLDNLKENIRVLEYRDRIKKIYDKLLSLKEDDEKIIIPISWKKY